MYCWSERSVEVARNLNRRVVVDEARLLIQQIRRRDLVRSRPPGRCCQPARSGSQRTVLEPPSALTARTSSPGRPSARPGRRRCRWKSCRSWSSPDDVAVIGQLYSISVMLPELKVKEGRGRRGRSREPGHRVAQIRVQRSTDRGAVDLGARLIRSSGSCVRPGHL